MTVITLTTVGFGEVLDIKDLPLARLFTIGLIIIGMGIFVTFVSTLTAMILEMDIWHVLRRKKMDRTIERLSHHVIVCGAGTTGIHIIEELITTHISLVVIDQNKERLERVIAEVGCTFPYIVGDATEDEILKKSGIERARGIVSALPNDKDNLYVIMSARQINPKIRIVTKGVEMQAIDKLRRAGANSVVMPSYIGGLRMASEMIRPQVVEFLDLMLRDKDKNLRIEEVTLPPNSFLIGKTLSEAQLREEMNLLVIAAREKDTPQKKYIYNPGPDLKLKDKMTLIILGESSSIVKLKQSLVTR
jgi:voltage-gated potassium channel